MSERLTDDMLEQMDLAARVRDRRELVEVNAGRLQAMSKELRSRRISDMTIREELFEEGRWRSCSGCHESDEGHSTGPYSDTFRCNLGSGCHECGGIGATWELFPDEDDVTAALATDGGNERG